MTAITRGNELVTFLLELAVYGAVIAWALSTSQPLWLRIGQAVAGAVAMGVLWGLFAAPKASMPLHGAALIAFEAAWFAVGALALWGAAGRQWALPVAVLFLISGAVRLAG